MKDINKERIIKLNNGLGEFCAAATPINVYGDNISNIRMMVKKMNKSKIVFFN